MRDVPAASNGGPVTLPALSRKSAKEPYQQQATLLAKLTPSGSELLRLDTDEYGALVIDETDAEVPVTDLLAEIELAMTDR